MSKYPIEIDPDSQTFVDSVLSGAADIGDIDDFIDAWHDAPNGSEITDLSLHEFLGLSWDEYRLWVEKPESLRFAFAARRAKVETSQLIAARARPGAAARSGDSELAKSVLEWLIQRGRIQESDM